MSAGITETTLLQKTDIVVKPRPTWKLYLDITRIQKLPAASLLVLSPFLWGVMMSAYRYGLKDAPRLSLAMLLWAIGGTVRHSAGCVWNDINDRKIDRLVERTKNRPLATGAISVSGALLMWIVLQGICVGLLTLTNRNASILGVFNLFVLDVIYPFAKRWTYWPQAVLGIALAFGIPISWVATVNSIDYPVVICLFVAKVCWTLHYDTIYGCQDRLDDEKVGIKSTAVLFGDSVRTFCAICSVLLVLCLTAAGYLNGQGPVYYILCIGGTALHLRWQFATLDFADVDQCGRYFVANGSLAYFILAGMVCDYVWKWLL